MMIVMGSQDLVEFIYYPDDRGFIELSKTL